LPRPSILAVCRTLCQPDDRPHAPRWPGGPSRIGWCAGNETRGLLKIKRSAQTLAIIPIIRATVSDLSLGSTVVARLCGVIVLCCQRISCGQKAKPGNRGNIVRPGTAGQCYIAWMRLPARPPWGDTARPVVAGTEPRALAQQSHCVRLRLWAVGRVSVGCGRRVSVPRKGYLGKPTPIAWRGYFVATGRPSCAIARTTDRPRGHVAVSRAGKVRNCVSSAGKTRHLPTAPYVDCRRRTCEAVAAGQPGTLALSSGANTAGFCAARVAGSDVAVELARASNPEPVRHIQFATLCAANPNSDCPAGCRIARRFHQFRRQSTRATEAEAGSPD